MTKLLAKTWIDKALRDDKSLCRVIALLFVLHMLGIIPDRDGRAATPPTTPVPVECFASGECRAMFPVPVTP